MAKQRVEIHTADIALDGLLKFASLVGSGGEAKHLIRSEMVRVNGNVETRRGRRVGPGDQVELLDEDEQVLETLEIAGPAS